MAAGLLVLGMLGAVPHGAWPAGPADEAARQRLREAFGPPCSDGAPPAPFALRDTLAPWHATFVAGRCLAAAGALEAAEERWLAGLAADQPEPTLWPWMLFQTRLLRGDHDGALAAMEQLLSARPGALLRKRLRRTLADATAPDGLVPEGRRRDYLIAYLERVEPAGADYDLMLRLWAAAQAAGNVELSRATHRLMWMSPKDKAAAKRWATLPGTPGPEGGVAVSAADYHARAERLFALRLYAQLVSELDNPALPAFEARYAKALGRLYFRALIRARKLQRATVQVSTGSVMRRFAFDRRQQLIWASRIQLRRRRIGPVLKYVQELEELSPADRQLPALFLELLKYNIGRGDQVTTRHWLERITKGYPGSSAASDAYWEMIWAAIRAGRHAEALPLLEEAIAAGGSFHPVDQARLYYWRGRLEARGGDRQRSADTWRELARRWPYGYYTALAERIRDQRPLVVGPSRDGAAPPAHAPPALDALWGIEPFPRALFLFAVGEADLAVEVLRHVLSRPLEEPVLQEASALFAYLGRHYLQLRLLANHRLDDLRYNEITDTPLWRRAFPRPHWGVVTHHADAQDIDPYFVFAVMREESRFFTFADSVAGAKGLMQLMPATARMVANRNGLDYAEERLHAPELNIPLGAIYLKQLLKRFGSNPIYAAAAYNAGPGNVRRWLRRHGKLPLDAFVERIPFGETQRYVKRVFLSYHVYSKLYR